MSFNLRVVSFDLNGTVTAEITNAGSVDAHNVWVKVEVFSQGTRVLLNGKDFLRVDVGTLKTGETATQQGSSGIGPLDAVKIMQNGAHFDLAVNSDEGTQVFTYDYKP